MIALKSVSEHTNTFNVILIKIMKLITLKLKVEVPNYEITCIFHNQFIFS